MTYVGALFCQLSVFLVQRLETFTRNCDIRIYEHVLRSRASARVIMCMLQLDYRVKNISNGTR